MGNFQNILQVINYLADPSEYIAKYGTTTTTTSTSTASFADVINSLNKSIDNSSTTQNMSSYGYNNYSFYNTGSTAITPDINAIVQKIQSNKTSLLDIDSQIRSYLLSNYGGSEEQVIKNLSGAQSLSTQVTSMESQIFQSIVTKISCQVRNTIYQNKDIADMSSFSSDDSTSSDSSSVSSSEDIYNL